MTADPGMYFTVNKNTGPREIREKGSRFIAFLYPVKGDLQASQIRGNLRKKYHDSTHICWSYRLFDAVAERFRYGDDGEPSGTAGMPIYYEIKGRDYFNVLLVVIRYFGGVKLGTGGLAKAYARAAREVLDVSQPMVQYVRQQVSVLFPFGFTGEIRQLIQQFSLEIVEQEYTSDGIRMLLGIPLIRLEEVESELIERSRGLVKLKIEPTETVE